MHKVRQGAMSDEETLHVHVARNIRAEAARRGLTQAQLGELLGISRVGITQRYGFHTPWTLDELERAARVFDVPLAVLTARHVEVPGGQGAVVDPDGQVGDVLQWPGSTRDDQPGGDG